MTLQNDVFNLIKYQSEKLKHDNATDDQINSVIDQILSKGKLQQGKKKPKKVAPVLREGRRMRRMVIPRED